VERDQKERHLGSGRVEAEEFLGGDHVGGTGNREEFAKTLEKSEDRDVEKVQVKTLSTRRRGDAEISYG
jgi:hypothetical protein